MYRESLGGRIVAVLLVVLLAAVSLGFTWAVVDDYSVRDVLPLGATIDGVEVGGLTRAEAEKVVEEKVKGPLLQPATVTFESTTFTLDPKDYVEVDVAGMLDEAARPKLAATLPERVYQRVTETETGRAVARKMRVDEAKLNGWVAQTASAVSSPSVDCKVIIGDDGAPAITASIPGRGLETTAAFSVVSEALLDGAKNVPLPVTLIPAAKNEQNMGKTIVVRRSKRRMWLFNGSALEVTYRIAVGMPGYPTPLGWWKIINKRYRPTWTNPHSAWSASMPEYIPPGPSNPLGTRALDLSASGIRFHGTRNIGSVGTAASHGCMRMYMKDIEALYPLVPVGTAVWITN
jgi:lipoprotein-anchoring transpeptidase ErfK/SrfK